MADTSHARRPSRDQVVHELNTLAKERGLLGGWVGWQGDGWDGGGMGGMVGGWVGWWGSGGPTPLLKILEPMLTPRSLHLKPWISFPALYLVL